MEKIYYNKLIRDNIPEKIQSKGSSLETRILSESEFEVELRKKVGEEASALPKSETREELISELADVLDVIKELQKTNTISDAEIAAAQEINFKKKGGFAKRLFLLWSSDDGYQTNETKHP